MRKIHRGKYSYKGWIIRQRTNRLWMAVRQSDMHIAPFDARTLRSAKQEIDNGNAALTSVEWAAKDYKQRIKIDIQTGGNLSHWHRASWLGNTRGKAIELALMELGAFDNGGVW